MAASGVFQDPMSDSFLTIMNCFYIYFEIIYYGQFIALSKKFVWNNLPTNCVGSQYEIETDPDCSMMHVFLIKNSKAENSSDILISCQNILNKSMKCILHYKLSFTIQFQFLQFQGEIATILICLLFLTVPNNKFLMI